MFIIIYMTNARNCSSVSAAVTPREIADAIYESVFTVATQKRLDVPVSVLREMANNAAATVALLIDEAQS